jgi:hypothetical protein
MPSIDISASDWFCGSSVFAFSGVTCDSEKTGVSHKFFCSLDMGSCIFKKSDRFLQTDSEIESQNTKPSDVIISHYFSYTSGLELTNSVASLLQLHSQYVNNTMPLGNSAPVSESTIRNSSSQPERTDFFSSNRRIQSAPIATSNSYWRTLFQARTIPFDPTAFQHETSRVTDSKFESVPTRYERSAYAQSDEFEQTKTRNSIAFYTQSVRIERTISLKSTLQFHNSVLFPSISVIPSDFIIASEYTHSGEYEQTKTRNSTVFYTHSYGLPPTMSMDSTFSFTHSDIIPSRMKIISNFVMASEYGQSSQFEQTKSQNSMMFFAQSKKGAPTISWKTGIWLTLSAVLPSGIASQSSLFSDSNYLVHEVIEHALDSSNSSVSISIGLSIALILLIIATLIVVLLHRRKQNSDSKMEDTEENEVDQILKPGYQSDIISETAAFEFEGESVSKLMMWKTQVATYSGDLWFSDHNEFF